MSTHQHTPQPTTQHTPQPTTQPTIDELRAMANKIASDPSSVKDLSATECAEVRKFIHPMGGVVSSKQKFAVMGICNLKDKYFRRLHMTAMTGYLFRLLEEYEPEDELDAERARYEKAVKAAGGDSAIVATLKAEHEHRLKLITDTHRKIVRKFLNRGFNYNPDHHLRGAHSDGSDGATSDPDRMVGKAESIVRQCKLAESVSEAKLIAQPEQLYKYMRSNILSCYQHCTEAAAALKSALRFVTDPDAQGIIMKKYTALNAAAADLGKIARPLAAADTLNAWKIDPPVDVFHQFDRYLTNHYEQLIDCTNALFNEKIDIDFAIILHDTFKTADEARQYTIQHESEFKTEVHTIASSQISLLGPYKENRGRVDYFNKNTEVMKRMMEQVESDQKLGGDLMKKAVKTKKTKNIAEAGPDAPELAAYSRVVNTVQTLGAKKVLSTEEMNELAEAKAKERSLREDFEVPDDAIQMDMYVPSADGKALERKVVYTAAEAPLFMDENSEFREKYQPVADSTDANESDNNPTKQQICGANEASSNTPAKKSIPPPLIVSRHGEKKSVADLLKRV